MTFYQLSLADFSDKPTTPELATRKVGANCHVAFKGVFYSVHHTLYNQNVILGLTRGRKKEVI